MISVCMATYNGERFIKQQIDSILSQLSSNDELIISDDGSTDNTLEIINSYNDSRIKLLHHVKENSFDGLKKGQNFYYATSNFENALKNVKGDYVYLTDQDDIWLFNKIIICQEILKQYDCVLHNFQIIDKEGNIVKDKMFIKTPIHRTMIKNIVNSPYRGCCMAFHSKYLQIILPIPKNVIGHDYWIGLIISHFTEIHYELQPLIQSRWYSDSVSAKRKTSLFYKLHYRYNLLIERIKRISLCKESIKKDSNIINF